MIIGVGGKLSGGKTITCVKKCYIAGMKGKKIISNIKLFFRDPKIKYEFMKSNDIVLFIKKNYEDSDKIKEKFYNSVLFVDEIINILSARSSATKLNELLTGFFMMAGKLSCDVLFTYQNLNSMVDVRLRTIMEKEGYCQRYYIENKKLKLLTEFDRIVNKEIRILVIWKEFDGMLGYKYAYELFDPKQYYQFYDTREVTLMDRTNFQKGGKNDLTKIKEEKPPETFNLEF